MSDSAKPSYANDIPFRGTGKATDFHDIQDYEEHQNLTDSMLEYSKENPLTSVVSLFGIGLIVGASAAVAMAASHRRPSSSSYYSYDSLKRMVNDAVSKASSANVRDIFRG